MITYILYQPILKLLLMCSHYVVSSNSETEIHYVLHGTFLLRCSWQSEKTVLNHKSSLREAAPERRDGLLPQRLEVVLWGFPASSSLRFNWKTKQSNLKHCWCCFTARLYSFNLPFWWLEVQKWGGSDSDPTSMSTFQVAVWSTRIRTQIRWHELQCELVNLTGLHPAGHVNKPQSTHDHQTRRRMTTETRKVNKSQTKHSRNVDLMDWNSFTTF